jgi:hypothetical protein
MKGYAVLDLDGNFTVKSYDYINSDNPGFFTQNKHLLIKYWLFNSEDTESITNMLRDFDRMGLPSPKIMELLKTIKFDITTLKKDANKI